MNNKISGEGVGDTFFFRSGETKIRQCIGDFPDYNGLHRTMTG